MSVDKSNQLLACVCSTEQVDSSNKALELLAFCLDFDSVLRMLAMKLQNLWDVQLVLPLQHVDEQLPQLALWADLQYLCIVELVFQSMH